MQEIFHSSKRITLSQIYQNLLRSNKSRKKKKNKPNFFNKRSLTNKQIANLKS